MLTASNDFKAAVLPGISSYRHAVARVIINAVESTDTIENIAVGGYEGATVSDEGGYYEKKTPLAVFAGGDTSAMVHRFAADDLSTYDSSASYGSTIYAMTSDGTYLYAGGSENTIAKYTSDGLEKIAETADLGYEISSMIYLAGFIYAACGPNVVKIDVSDMSKTAQSASYGAYLIAIATDGTYVYAAGGFAVGKVFKYDATDLSKLQESAVFGSVSALTTDDTYVYAAGYHSPGTSDVVFQLYQTDLSKKAESSGHSGMVIYGLTVLNGYVYAAGNVATRIFKIDVADMSDAGQSASYGDTVTALANDGTYVYAACGSTTTKVMKFAASDLSTADQSGETGDTLYAICVMPEVSLPLLLTTVFSGSVNGEVNGINRSDMVDFVASSAISGVVEALANDGQYIFAAIGEKVYKYLPSDMSLIASSANYGSIRALAYNDGSIYCAGSGQKVTKLLAADLSYVDESAGYGSTIQALACDATHVYAAGDGGSVVKYLMSDMSTVAQSSAISGGVNALTCDDTHIYAGGNGRIVRKVLLSSMAIVTSSGDYYGSIRALANFGDYLYVGGTNTRQVWKLAKSSMAKIAASPLTDYISTIYAIETDGANVYAGIGDSQYDLPIGKKMPIVHRRHAVLKYATADMSIIGQSREYLDDIRSLTIGSDYPIVQPVIVLETTGITSLGMTIYFGLPGTPYPTEFTIKLKNEGVVVRTITVTGNTKNYVRITEALNPDDLPCDEVVISFVRMSSAYTRVRVSAIRFGVEQQYSDYGDEGFYSVSTIHEADHTCLTLPSGDARVIVDNVSGDYNPFEPTGFAEWLQIGARMLVEMGVYTDAVTREFVKIGTYWFSEWREVGYKQVELLGRDSIGYYGDLPALAHNAGWTAGANVETYIDDVFSWAGIPSDMYDVSPFPGADSSFLAGPAADTVRDESRLMAQWLMKICTCDADGVIRFINPSAAPDSSIDLDDCYSMPKVDRQELVGSIDVSIYTATLGDTDEVIAIHKEDVTGEEAILVWIGWDYGDLSVAVVGEASYIDNGFSYGYYSVSVIGSGAQVTVTVSGKRYNIAKTTYTLVNSSAAGSRENKIIIDNPHIRTRVRAAAVAAWTLANLNKLIKMTYDWRGNPLLEPLDMVIAETSHGNKNMIVTRQDLIFNGFLSGQIEGIL